MKKQLFLIITIFCTTSIFCQQEKYNRFIDSLENELKTENISKKIVLYDELAWQLRHNNSKKAIQYAQEGLKIATKEYEFKKVGFYNTLGLISASKSDTAKAVKYYKKSIAISKKLGKQNTTAATYTNIGILHWNLDNHKKAIEYYNLAEKSASIKEDSIRAIHLLNAISINKASLFLELNQFSKALNQYLKAEKILVKFNREQELCALYANMGDLHAKIDNYKTALFYYKKALFFDIKLNNLKDMAVSNTKVGIMYQNIQKNDSAFHHLSEGLKIAKKGSYKSELSFSYYALGNYYKRVQDYKNCVKYSKLSLQYANVNQDKDNIIRSHINIADAYLNSKQANYVDKHLKSAYELTNNTMLGFRKSIYSQYTLYYYYHRKIEKANFYKKKNDSITKKINKNETTKVVEELKTKYETQQKENQILKQQTELQENQLALKNQQQTTSLALLGVGMLLLLGGVYIQKRKRDEKLRLLNQTIQTSEEEKIRIGRELHDGVASSLLKTIHETENTTLTHKLLNSYNEIRTLSHQLNNTPMHGEIFIERLYELLPKNTSNKKYKLSVSPQYLELQEPFGTHFYRIIQELITNNLKHSNASLTEIEIKLENNKLQLSYKDDGIIEHHLKKGSGLKNIEDRVSLMKGTINFKTENGFETDINVIT